MRTKKLAKSNSSFKVKYYRTPDNKDKNYIPQKDNGSITKYKQRTA